MNQIQLKVTECYSRDVGRGIARIDYDTMDILNTDTGHYVEIKGKEKKTIAKVLPLYPSDEGRKIIRMDGLIRNNSGVALNDAVEIRPIAAADAITMVVTPVEPCPPMDMRYLADALEGVGVRKDDSLIIPYLGGRLTFKVADFTPAWDAVVITSKTEFSFQKTPRPPRIPNTEYEACLKVTLLNDTVRFFSQKTTMELSSLRRQIWDEVVEKGYYEYTNTANNGAGLIPLIAIQSIEIYEK